MTVVDPGSNNGTWVRDQPLRHHEPYTLQNGEVLRLARTLISIRPSRPRHDALSSDGTRQRQLQPPAARAAPVAPAEGHRARPARQAVEGQAAARRLADPAGARRRDVPGLPEPDHDRVHGDGAGDGGVQLRRGAARGQEGRARRRSSAGTRRSAKLDADLRALAVEEERERNLGAPDAGELDPPRGLAQRRPVGAPPDRSRLPARAHRHRRPARRSTSCRSSPAARRASASARPTSRTSTGRSPPRRSWSPIPDAGAVGLGGAPQGVVALTRWLLVQAITLHSPRELADRRRRAAGAGAGVRLAEVGAARASARARRSRASRWPSGRSRRAGWSRR